MMKTISFAFLVACCGATGSVLAQEPARTAVEAASAVEAEPEQARLAIHGGMRIVKIGQDSYCGKRQFVPEAEYKRVMVRGGKRVWIDTTDLGGSMRCDGEWTFVPEPGAVYVFRYVGMSRDYCMAELYRATPEFNLVPARIELAKREVCIGK